MKYSPSDIMELTGKSRETIRIWSRDFAKFLSPGANPKPGGHRVYDDDDLGVFFLIKEMSERNISYDEIALTLAQGERAVIPENNKSIALTQQEQVQALQNTVVNLQTEISKRDGRIDELNRQLEATKNELREAYKQIGKLEG